MKVTISPPNGVVIPGRNTWYLCPKEDWTVGHFLADVAKAAKISVEEYKLQKNGIDLSNEDKAHVVLDDGETIALVEK